jgi:hypothetical protein
LIHRDAPVTAFDAIEDEKPAAVNIRQPSRSRVRCWGDLLIFDKAGALK